MLSAMESERADASAQLSSLAAGRAALAGRAMQPWWYDAALGLVVFALLGTLSARDTVLQLVVDGAALVALVGLKRAYERHTGFWVNGFRRGRTRRVIAVLLGLYAVVVAAGLAAEHALGWRGAMVVAGAVLGLAAAVCSRWWTRVYVAELRAAR
jgi:hypothetical protein